MEVVIPNVGELHVVINSRNANQVRSRGLLCTAALDVHLTVQGSINTGNSSAVSKQHVRARGIELRLVCIV